LEQLLDSDQQATKKIMAGLSSKILENVIENNNLVVYCTLPVQPTSKRAGLFKDC